MNVTVIPATNLPRVQTSLAHSRVPAILALLEMVSIVKVNDRYVRSNTLNKV